MPFAMTLYGRGLTDVIARGNIDEMREMATVSSFLRRTQGSDLEDGEMAEWDAAHSLLLSAIAEKSSIVLAKENVIAIRDGLVIIDNIQLARALKALIMDDAEGYYWEFKIGSK